MGLCPLHLNSKKLSATNLFESNLKAIGDTNMDRSGCFVQMFCVNIEKGCAHHQLWAEKTPRGSHLVETVKLCDSDVH